MLNQMFVVLVLLALIAIGDVVSRLSRARVPSLLVSMLLFLLAIWTGLLDTEAVETSALVTFGTIFTAILLVHLGTMIPFDQLRKQWRFVLIALGGMLAGVLAVLGIVTPIFGYESAVVGAGPLSGGFIATLITTTRLEELGRDELIAIPVLVLGVQQLVGMPLASFFLRRYAARFVRTLRTVQPNAEESGAATGGGGKAATSQTEVATTAQTKRQTRLPAVLEEPSALLALLAVAALAATWISGFTQISATLWALLIGIALCYMRILPGYVLEKAGSFNIVLIAVTLVIIASLSDITPQLLVESIAPVAVILGVGAAGIFAGGYLMSRLLRVDVSKGIPVALTAMFGFPGDYLISQEVATSLTDNDDERETVLEEIFPPLLIGGFTSVTVASVVIASILVTTL